MLGEPDAADLLEAVAGFLERTALPALSGHAAFHARVAINALGIVQRELRDGPGAEAAERAGLAALLGREGTAAELRRFLVAEIRAGRMSLATPGLLDHLLATAANRVAIEQPSYPSLALVS